MSRILIAISLLASIILQGCASVETSLKPQKENELNGRISRQEALDKIQAGAAVFDARSDEEFQSGHFPNAINLPHNLLEPTLPAIQSYKDREIVVYCASGRRAEQLRVGLIKAGFTRVYNVGGLSDLEQK